MKAHDMAPVASEAMVASALLDAVVSSVGGHVSLPPRKRSATYDVWSSLLPLHMMTSAGDVLVRLVFS
jgi:hypothetical protein